MVEPSRPSITELYADIGDTSNRQQHVDVANAIEADVEKVKPDAGAGPAYLDALKQRGQVGYIRIANIQGVDYAVLCLPSLAFVKLAITRLMPSLAKRGILCHVMSGMYKVLKQTLRKDAQAFIRAITAHNGKLGFNWNIATG